MNKEDLLLKNYAILSKDPNKNSEALKSAIGQLIEINPKLGIRCWEECIDNNMEEISKDFGKEEFDYSNPGHVLVYQFESEFCEERYFVEALEVFANNKSLLDTLYAKSPLSDYFGGKYAISYLIRKNRLQEADNILSAVYKNQNFTKYSDLWDSVISMFEYGDSYKPGIYFSQSHKQPESIRDFCIGWIEKIKDEEEQAGAMTFAMKMF